MRGGGNLKFCPQTKKSRPTRAFERESLKTRRRESSGHLGPGFHMNPSCLIRGRGKAGGPPGKEDREKVYPAAGENNPCTRGKSPKCHGCSEAGVLPFERFRPSGHRGGGGKPHSRWREGEREESASPGKSELRPGRKELAGN